MAASEVAGAVSALQACQLALRGPASRQRMTALGVQLKPVGSGAVRLGGDNRFSNWRRGAPIELGVAFKLHRDDSGLTMHRDARSAGPFRVAEEGRKGGVSRGRKGGKRARGSAKGSGRAAPKAGRRVGAMAGKRQWTAASNAMGSRAPQLLAEAITRDVVEAFAKGG